jgi:predicted acyltransferase (DUF342 family)
LNEKNVIEDTKAVINEEFIGDLLPLKHIQIKRDIFLQPKANVKGGIYGRDINIKVGAKAKGPLLANRNLTINYDESVKDTSVIKSDIYAIESIKSIMPENACSETAINTKQVLIYGDVCSRVVNLRNAEVFGKIIANTVDIDNCIVHGWIIARTSSARLNNSTAFSVYAKGDINMENSKVIYPYLYSETGYISVGTGVGLVTDIGDAFVLRKSDIHSSSNGTIADIFWRLGNSSAFEKNLRESIRSYNEKVSEVIQNNL